VMSWALVSALLHPVDKSGRLAALLKKRVMLVGYRAANRHLSHLAEEHLAGSIEIVRVFELARSPIGSNSEAIASAADDVATAAGRCGASSIVVAGVQPGSSLADVAIELKCRGHEVFNLESLLQNYSGTVDPCASYEARVVFEPWPRHSVLTRALKRARDVSLAVIMLAIVGPLFAALAVGVKLTSRGPILYRQTRTGLHGAPFEMLKVRSMHADAERDGNPKWATINDDRVTRFGRLLRRSHLDELPQLINILRGDMSFVGPRPERPAFVSELASRIPCYRLRHMMKPGLTGWAQINYPYSATIEETRKKLAYDLYYLEHAGFLFDLFILARTVRVVAFGRGAR
jgi:exopolysaccharide biosynthesis polyprenyl glycosylphosphotransferase